ncbi:MAG: hypothetical protein Kow0010_00860 [Dehalococcoidia bacterium]
MNPLRKDAARSVLSIGLVWLLAALLAASIGMACAGDGESTGSGSNTDDELDAHSDTGHAEDAHAGEPEPDVEIVVHAQDVLRFDPAEIRVRAGQRVRLVLDNAESSALHDFTIEEIAAEDVHAAGATHAHQDEGAHYAIHVAAEPGETATVEFTPTKPGTYEFLCTVPGHAAAGMVGTLIVEE